MKKHDKTPVEYLESLGLLSSRLLAAHCVWLSEKDIGLLAQRRVNVVHCPVSNLKLAAGIAPVNRLLAAGVNVCLGTDGASSNNNLDLFEEMKMAAIIQKNACSRPEALSAKEIWDIATANAYQATGLALGLAEGSLADLSLIDLRKPWLMPQSNILSLLVYSMADGVDTTIVNGKILMREGVIPGEAEILDKAQERFERLTS